VKDKLQKEFWEFQRILAISGFVRRKPPMVFIQPKISSTRLRNRLLVW